MILLQRIQHLGQAVDILIDGGRIVRISPEPLEAPAGCETADCRGKAVLPGFVNMHTHAAMILLRGIHEDLALYDWASKAACLEMIRSGTTTFNDQYWHCPRTREAAVEMGIRPAVSFIFLDGGNPALAQKQRKDCEALYAQTLSWGKGSQFVISIHSVYTVCEENILWARDFAREHGLRIHLHVAETALEDSDCRKAHGGLSPVEYFESLGVWGMPAPMSAWERTEPPPPTTWTCWST